MNLRKCILLLACFFMAINANAITPQNTDEGDTDISGLDNVMYVEPLKCKSGIQINLPILMKNSAEIRGFQFNLYLPEGLTIAKNAKGKLLASLSSGRRDEYDEHTLSVAKQDDGSYLFLCGSLAEDIFLGNDGEIATVTLNISTNIAKGEYPVIIKNQKLTENDISKYYEKAYVETYIDIDASRMTIVLAEETSSMTDGKYLKNGQLVIKKDDKEYE